MFSERRAFIVECRICLLLRLCYKLMMRREKQLIKSVCYGVLEDMDEGYVPIIYSPIRCELHFSLKMPT